MLDAERPLVPADVYAIGSMLSYDERLLLHWAARTAPPGAIVDLGSFLGGSTLALARGASHRDALVDAYDRFVLSEESQRTWLPDDADVALGASTRPVFDRNVGDVGDRLSVHEGDIQEHPWRKGPIGVLFVDIAKSWTIADCVWRTFLPAVRTGGLVIQQDLVHWGHPWCAVVMEYLRDHLEWLGWVWYSSAVYRVRSPVDELPVPLLDRLTCEDMLTLIDRAAERVGEPAAGSIRLSAAFVFGAFGRWGEARGRVAEIRAAYDNSVLPYIEEGFVFLDDWIDDVEAGRRSRFAMEKPA